MKSFKYISLFTLYFLLYTICFAQNELLTFNRVPPPTGLHPGTKAAVQDSQGYIWIGTYQAPLRRYDGYHYTFYSHDPLDSNSLAQNWVEALCAGRNGTIWIGTADSGLDRLDPSTGRFKHFRYNPKNDNSLINNHVTAILEDKEGVLWVGTKSGLNRYNPKTGKFQRFYYQSHNFSSLSCNSIEKIYEDRQGNIWIGTGSVWDGGSKSDDGGLNRFDGKTNRFIQYLHNPNNPHSLINNKVKAIFEDSRGTFWVGTAGDGLHIMNRTNGTFERLLYDPAHPEKLSRPAQKQIRPAVDDHITFIIEDAANAIWIGTFGNGLNRYDPKTNKITHYPFFKDPVSGMQLEVAWWACNSRDGMLWIGYWRGIYRIDPLRKNIPYFPTGTAITEMYQDRFGVLWYGSDEGLVQKDRRTGVEYRFVSDRDNPNSISNNRIGAIYEDHKGELWIGTDKGLDRFERRTNKFFHYRCNSGREDSLINKGVEAIYEDRQGSMWLGLQNDLLRINPHDNNIIAHYQSDSEDTNRLSNGQGLHIYEDRSGNLWILTFGGTLNKLSPQTGKVQRFLNGTNIHNVWQDSEGVLWVGTSIGLYRSNAALNAFSRFNGPNGEFEGNMIVNGLLEDNEKALWINASIGICRLNPQRNQVKIFSRHEDPTWYNGTGSYKAENGELFFGGSSGYFTFLPQQLIENTKPPAIVINEFRLNEHVILPGKESVLKQPLSQTKEIRLNHNQNVFSFNFAGIHYSNPQQNQHLFMLQGLDNTWRKAGEDKTAYYYNVPPGHYVFRIKAANSDGAWAEKAIAVIIDPPWWRTWWAYVIYVLGIVIIIWMFTSYRSRRLRMENILLEQKVIKRTNELKQSIEEKYELTKKIESQQALLNERLRISRELHDDIGSTLGSISIYSEVAKKRTEKNENTDEVLSKIGLASRELIDKMSDIVWSLNPNNESFEQLQNRMITFAAMILTPQNIQYDFTADERLKELQFAGEQCKSIFLIFKEALHNIVKYADCKTVSIKLSVKKNNVIMTIKDDGKGFDASQINGNEIFFNGGLLGGNGIKNMNARASYMNAMLCINSKINEGTDVQLTLRL